MLGMRFVAAVLMISYAEAWLALAGGCSSNVSIWSFFVILSTLQKIADEKASSQIDYVIKFALSSLT